ncbi:hypothetical protein HK098_004882, partial [Nowakowskiella sp. JEL0407]
TLSNLNSAGNLQIHLTSSKASSAFPFEYIPSENEMLKDVLNNRKLWILRNDVKKSNTLSSDLQVNIHYLDGNTIKQYSIVIPSKDPDPYTTLVRKGRAKAPLEFTSENVDYTVAFTLSGENSNSPGCSEFTQGDLQRLQDDESKLWIEVSININMFEWLPKLIYFFQSYFK